MKKREKLGYFHGIVSGISYGTNPLFSLPMFAVGFNVSSILFYRYIIATVMYYIYLKIKNRLDIKLSRKEIFPVLVLAILFALSSIFLFEAFRFMDSGLACTLLYVYPIMVTVIMYLFFKEKINIYTFISIVSAFIGVVLLHKSSDIIFTNFKGLILTMGSALSYAVYIVCVKHMKSASSLSIDKLSFYTMLIGIPIYFIYSGCGVELKMVYGLKLWGCILCLALIPTLIAIETTNLSIRLLGATRMSILGALEPVTAVSIGIVVFNEKFDFFIFLGIASILFGVILLILKSNKK